ncbi:MAG: M12 family metallo-peptidase [Phycisphaerae bacterium]
MDRFVSNVFSPTRIRRAAWACSAAAVLALSTVAHAGDGVATAAPRDQLLTSLAGQANNAIGLVQSTVITLDVPQQVGVPFRIVVPIEGQVYTLNLAPHSVRSPLYQVLVQIADGSLVPTQPGPVRTMRGSIEEVQGAIVAASLLDTGLDALVTWPDGTRHAIEPLAKHVAGASLDQYVVYRTEDIVPHGGECGTLALGGPINNPAPRGAGSNCPTLCIAELGVDADVEYVNSHGGVTGTEAQINTVINFLNTEYENQVGITHQITTIITRASEPDPYSSLDAFGLLNQFRNEWLSNQGAIQRDVAHLFTGKNINGNIIGIAWTIGGICTNQAFCLSQSDCCGGLGCAGDLSAHELGHLWGGFHCNSQVFSTMNTPLQCANTFNNCNPSSIASITAHRSSRTCLAPFGDATPPAPTPSFILPVTITETSAAMTSTTVFDVDSPPVQYFFQSNGNFGATDSGWQLSTTYTDIGLTPNTGYIYWVKARDSSPNLNETPLSVPAIVRTLAAVPGAPILTNPTTSSIDANVDPATNPSFTVFAVQVSATSPADPTWDGQFVDATGNPSAAAVWQTDALWGTKTLLGLQAGTTYTLQVKARNTSGVETAFGPTASLATSAAAGGACCLADGSCSVQTSAACATAGGTFQGNGSACTAGLCPQPCALLGDINGDGLVLGDDIAGFVRVKLGSPDPADAGTCADFGSGTLAGDIAAFVTTLLN